MKIIRIIAIVVALIFSGMIIWAIATSSSPINYGWLATIVILWIIIGIDERIHHEATAREEIIKQWAAKKVQAIVKEKDNQIKNRDDKIQKLIEKICNLEESGKLSTEIKNELIEIFPEPSTKKEKSGPPAETLIARCFR